MYKTVTLIGPNEFWKFRPIYNTSFNCFACSYFQKKSFPTKDRPATCTLCMSIIIQHRSLLHILDEFPFPINEEVIIMSPE